MSTAAAGPGIPRLPYAIFYECLESDDWKSKPVSLHLPVEKFRILIHLNLDIVIDVKRLPIRSILICSVSVALLSLYVAVWLSFAGSPAAKRSDFMIYYAAAKVPRSELYNIDVEREMQTRVLGSPFPVVGGVMPFNHTPVLIPLLHLLVNDDYRSSYLRWTVLLWLAAFVCAFMVFRMTSDVGLAFAAGSFYPLFIYVQQAHDTIFLLLGVLLCAHLLSQRKDVLAGIALSLTALKPHFAIFLGLPLIARPRAFLGFCAASTLLAIYCVLLIGTEGVSEFIRLLRISAAGESFGIRPQLMVNLLGLMERTGVSHDVARPVAWIIFLLAAISMLMLWKRSPLNPPIALTVVLAVLTSPHLYLYDLALLLVSFATLSKSNSVLLLLSSLALIGSNLISGNWQFAAAYLLMGALLAMSIKDVSHPALQLNKGTVFPPGP